MKPEQLVHLRKEKGLTQQEVSDRAGIDRSYYSKIETGMTPSVRVAKQLGKTLGFTWTLFFEGDCANIEQNSKEII